MKKSLLLGLSLFGVLALTGCSLFFPNNGESGGGKSSNTPADSKVYGTGAEEEKLIVDADIPKGEYVVFATGLPEGERAHVIVYNSASTQITNVYFSDSNGFTTSSMVQLKAGQAVVAKYCTFKNINSNPSVTKLEDGIFKVGTHFNLKNKTLKIRGTSASGRYCIYKSLEDVGGYYTHANLTTSQVTNLLSEGENVSIPYIENGAYVEVDGAMIVVD